jgi:hypothetical protein
MPGAARLRHILPLAVSSGALAASLIAQSSPPAPQPIFRTRTEHVSLDVVVTDKDDRTITDLTAADFQVTDANRPQTIADFRLVSVRLTSP